MWIYLQYLESPGWRMLVKMLVHKDSLGMFHPSRIKTACRKDGWTGLWLRLCAQLSAYKLILKLEHCLKILKLQFGGTFFNLLYNSTPPWGTFYPFLFLSFNNTYVDTLQNTFLNIWGLLTTCLKECQSNFILEVLFHFKEQITLLPSHDTQKLTLKTSYKQIYAALNLALIRISTYVICTLICAGWHVISSEPSTWVVHLLLTSANSCSMRADGDAILTENVLEHKPPSERHNSHNQIHNSICLEV